MTNYEENEEKSGFLIVIADDELQMGFKHSGNQVGTPGGSDALKPRMVTGLLLKNIAI